MPLFDSFTGAAARALGIISSDPPGTPSVTSQTATATSITVAFSISDGAFPIVAVEYQYALSSGAYPNDWTIVSGATRSVTLSGLATSATYKFRVRARDQAGQYSVVTEITQVTSSEVAPTAPSSLTVTPASTTSLSVSFGASTAGTYPIDRYQYSLDGGSYQNTGVSPGQTFTISGLGINSSHSVAVKAIAASPGTSVSGATTTPSNVLTNPSIPGTPSVNWSRMTTSDRDSAKLTWPSVATSETGSLTYYVNSYEVNASGSVIATLPQQTTTNTQIDVATSPNKNYRFSVFARNRIGQDSATSSERALTTGQTDVPYYLYNYDVEVHIAKQRAGQGTTGSIFVNFPASIPGNSWEAGYIRIDTMSVEVRRAQYTGDSPFTSDTFGNTEGMFFQLVDNVNGLGNVLTSWALPSTKTAAQGFNVHGQYSGTVGPVTTQSPFVVSAGPISGGSIAGRSVKVTAISGAFTQVTTAGVIASPSNNLIAKNLFLIGVTTTASSYS